jgi:hypothetical protein
VSENEQVKKILEELFKDICNRTEITIVPDKNDPYNLDKAMVYMITEPDPYAGLYLKRF